MTARNSSRRRRPGSWPAALLVLLVPLGSAAAESGRKPVRSLMEMRQAQVVRQDWDLSCGAAALSTLLTYQHGDPVPEARIVAAMLRRTDPVRVRARQGFSLLDLKRFAQSRGYEADGYGRLTLADLVKLGPAIMPTVIGGYNHFVVFRGLAGDRVLLADPAYGNRTMRIDRFEALWPQRVAFVVARPGGGVPPPLAGAGLEQLRVPPSAALRAIFALP